MRIIRSGLPNRDFTTIDVTLTDAFDGIKITSNDSNTQLQLRISNQVELQKFKELVTRMTVKEEGEGVKDIA